MIIILILWCAFFLCMIGCLIYLSINIHNHEKNIKICDEKIKTIHIKHEKNIKIFNKKIKANLIRQIILIIKIHNLNMQEKKLNKLYKKL